MINIAVFKQNNKVVGYQVSGHSGHAPKGQDIVCAAVSALAQTGLLALNRLLQVEPEYDLDSGFLYCRVNDADDKLEESSLILETMYVGFTEIEKKHSDYVKVVCKEVQ